MIIGGKFILGSQIGSGAFGKIFEGQNKETGEKVAIKIVFFSNLHRLLIGKNWRKSSAIKT